MHDFEGDLLIGGMRLKHLHGELEQEGPEANDGEWLLAGRLDLSPEEQKLLELNRRYRLQLEDGRAGQVVISNIEADAPDHVVAQFKPSTNNGSAASPQPR
jgi:hypothetical protein